MVKRKSKSILLSLSPYHTISHLALPGNHPVYLNLEESDYEF